MALNNAERSRLYRRRNADKVRHVEHARQAVERAKRREWIDAYKLERGCADCGYNAHPHALDFDHVGDDKFDDVGRIARGRIAWDRLMAEIAKCEVVCANCHRIRTYNRARELPKPPPVPAGMEPLFEMGATS